MVFDTKGIEKGIKTDQKQRRRGGKRRRDAWKWRKEILGEE